MLLFEKKCGRQDWVVHITCLVLLLRSLPDIFLAYQQNYFNDQAQGETSLLPPYVNEMHLTRNEIISQIQHLLRYLHPDDLRYLIDDPGGQGISEFSDDFNQLENLGGMLGENMWSHSNIIRRTRDFSPSTDEVIERFPPKYVDSMSQEQDITDIMNRLNSLAGGRGTALLNGITGQWAQPTSPENDGNTPRGDPNTIQAFLLQTGGAASSSRDDTSSEHLLVSPTMPQPTQPVTTPSSTTRQSTHGSQFRAHSAATTTLGSAHGLSSTASSAQPVASQGAHSSAMSNFLSGLGATGLRASRPQAMSQLMASVNYMDDLEERFIMEQIWRQDEDLGVSPDLYQHQAASTERGASNIAERGDRDSAWGTDATAGAAALSSQVAELKEVSKLQELIYTDNRVLMSGASVASASTAAAPPDGGDPHQPSTREAHKHGVPEDIMGSMNYTVDTETGEYLLLPECDLEADLKLQEYLLYGNLCPASADPTPNTSSSDSPNLNIEVNANQNNDENKPSTSNQEEVDEISLIETWLAGISACQNIDEQQSSGSSSTEAINNLNDSSLASLLEAQLTSTTSIADSLIYPENRPAGASGSNGLGVADELLLATPTTKQEAEEEVVVTEYSSAASNSYEVEDAVNIPTGLFYGSTAAIDEYDLEALLQLTGGEEDFDNSNQEPRIEEVPYEASPAAEEEEVHRHQQLPDLNLEDDSDSDASFEGFQEEELDDDEEEEEEEATVNDSSAAATASLHQASNSLLSRRVRSSQALAAGPSSTAGVIRTNSRTTPSVIASKLLREKLSKRYKGKSGSSRKGKLGNPHSDNNPHCKDSSSSRKKTKSGSFKKQQKKTQSGRGGGRNKRDSSSSSGCSSGSSIGGSSPSFTSPYFSPHSADEAVVLADTLEEDSLLLESLDEGVLLDSNFMQMIQTSYSKAGQGRMGGMLRGCTTMDQRWQDLASLLSLPSPSSSQHITTTSTTTTPTAVSPQQHQPPLPIHHHQHHHTSPPPPSSHHPHHAPHHQPQPHHHHSSHHTNAPPPNMTGSGAPHHPQQQHTPSPHHPSPLHHSHHPQQQQQSSPTVHHPHALYPAHHHHDGVPRPVGVLLHNATLPPTMPDPVTHNITYSNSMGASSHLVSSSLNLTNNGGGDQLSDQQQQQHHHYKMQTTNTATTNTGALLPPSHHHDVLYYQGGGSAAAGDMSGGSGAGTAGAAGGTTPSQQQTDGFLSMLGEEELHLMDMAITSDCSNNSTAVMSGPHYPAGAGPPPHYPPAPPPVSAMDTTPAPPHIPPDPMELKYSCSMDFRSPHDIPSVELVQHNHTYHMSPDGPSGLPRPTQRDPKSKSRSKQDPERTLTRDEKRARALNLPITCDDIINLPMDEFNERISTFDLSEPQLTLIRDIRRRGKNKVAAQNCRKRKLDQIMHLAEEVKVIQTRKNELLSQNDYLTNERLRVKHKCSLLYKHIFQHLRNSDGQPYSPHEYNLQQSADGSVLLVRRSSPHTPLDPGLHPPPSSSNNTKQPHEDNPRHH